MRFAVWDKVCAIGKNIPNEQNIYPPIRYSFSLPPLTTTKATQLKVINIVHSDS
jgi:hypothetical protein